MGIILVLISAFGFSTLGIFGKLVMDSGIPRTDALFLRFLVAVPLFGIVLLMTRAIPRNPRVFLKAMVVGGIGIGIESTLFFLTLEEVGAGLTAIFLYLYPAFVALISFFVFKERLTKIQWFCILLSFVGCVLTVDYQSARVSDWGVIFGVLMGAWYAIYLIAGERISKTENPLIISAGVTCGSLIFSAVVLAVKITTQDHSLILPANSSQLWSLLGLASVATVLPFATLYAGMKRIGVTKTSIFSTSEMIFTLILAAAVLGERLVTTQWIGAAFILVSILLMKWSAIVTKNVPEQINHKSSDLP